jgi:hypothetical protein
VVAISENFLQLPGNGAKFAQFVTTLHSESTAEAIGRSRVNDK